MIPAHMFGCVGERTAGALAANENQMVNFIGWQIVKLCGVLQFTWPGFGFPGAQDLHGDR